MAAGSGISFILGVVGGAVSGAAVQFFRFAADDRNRRVDELVNDILKAADLATEYWHKDGTEKDISRLEDHLQGAQHRISLLVHDVLPEVNERAPEIERHLADFIDAITGGEFRSVRRPSSQERSLSGQLQASTLVLAVRKARRLYSPYPIALVWTGRNLLHRCK